MMLELLTVSVPGAALVVLVWGLLPAVIARAASRCLPRSDPRRSKLMSELYARPRMDQPFWATQQLERAIVESLVPRMLRKFQRTRRKG